MLEFVCCKICNLLVGKIRYDEEYILIWVGMEIGGNTSVTTL